MLGCACLLPVPLAAVAGESSSAGAGDGIDQQTLVTSQAASFTNPSWSPDGAHLALTDRNHDGVYVLDVAVGACLAVTDAPSSGYAYNWSADGRYLGFKLLIPRNGEVFPLQVPALFDVQKQQLIRLYEPVVRAGVPSFTKDGLIAYTIDQELRIVTADLQLVKTFALGTYANLAPISPDGSKAVFNNGDDQIWEIDLASGTKRQLTSDLVTHFAPLWSPDSGKLVVSTLTGRLKSIDVTGAQVQDLGEGTSPSWSPDSATVYYCKTQRVDGIKVLRSDVYAVGWNRPDVRQVVEGGSSFITAARVAPDGKSLAAVDLASGEVTQLTFDKSMVNATTGTLQVAPTKLLAGPKSAVTTWSGGQVAALQASAVTSESKDQITLSLVQVLGSVPYIHQVYDTPNWFSGSWACGATSAMMALQYYSTLPNWDCTVSVPTSHVSHFGRYICETYTYNGYTYNTASPDPNGTSATGGYGYIVRNDWADTRGYMRDYIIQHGLGSSVDWSPTWSELQTEVNNNHPFVLLNMLTSAGHYITTIGYFSGQQTAIFNDPYGNKNNGYMNYSGAGVYYDWPGYSNGYSNLNTVSCFIYCRGTINVAPSITQHPTNQVVALGATATFQVSASGSGTLSYQWQKNGTNLSNGGHNSGATTATLTVSTCDSNDVASYRCKVTNAYGNATSNAATLTIGAPANEFIVESRANGLNYANYSESGTWSDSSGKSTASGVTAGIGSRLAYIGVADRNAVFSFTPTVNATYEVFVTGPYSANTVCSAHHVVTHAGGSADVYVDQNQTTNPGYSTRWTSLGEYTMNAGVTYTVTATSTNSSAGTGGTVLRADAIKWAWTAPEPPTITQSPSGQTVCRNGTVGFTVAATSAYALSYQWQKNATDLAEGGHYSGVATSTLTISSADEDDVANYRCVVTSLGGSTTSGTGALGLKSDTVVEQQPASLRVRLGAAAQFTVVAGGEGTISYQWQKDGVALADGGDYSGATSSTLTISNCDNSDVAGYSCVINAACGGVTSAVASLQVGQPADFDADSDVDQDDWAVMQRCLGLTGLSANAVCSPTDMSGNGSVGSEDASLFIGCMSASGVAAQLDCTPLP
jgi:Tol biopolymer transport system component